MNETYVTTHGNVVADPVRRRTVAGDPYVTFRIASTVRRRRTETGEYYDAYTNFHDVVAFRQLAVNAAASLRKGQPVIVHGQQRIKQWTSGEKTGTDVEVEASMIGHDLRRGTCDFRRLAGAPTGPDQPPAALAAEGLATTVSTGSQETGREPQRLAG